MIKPGPWAFDRARVDPRWAWVWERSPVWLYPILTPFGPSIDAVGSFSVEDVSGNANNGRRLRVNPGVRQWGRGLVADQSAGNSGVTVLNNWSLSGTDPITFGLIVDLPTAGDGWLMAQATEIVLRITGGQYEFILNSFSSNDRVSGGTAKAGPQVIVGHFDGAELSIWVAGDKVGATTPTGGYADSTSDLEFFYSANGPMDATLLGACMWGGGVAVSDAQIRQFSLDPFGPFRPIEPRAYLPSAPSADVVGDIPPLTFTLAPQTLQADVTANVVADVPALAFTLAPRSPRAEPVALFADVVRPGGGFDPAIHLGADAYNDPNVVTGDQVYAYASTGGPLTTLREDTSFVMAAEGEITYAFWDATDDTWGAEQTVPVTEDSIGVEADIPALAFSLAPQAFVSELSDQVVAEVPVLTFTLAPQAFVSEVTAHVVGDVPALAFTLAPQPFQSEITADVVAELPALAFTLAPQAFQSELTAHVVAELPALAFSLALQPFEAVLAGPTVPVTSVSFSHRGPSITITEAS